MIEIIYSQPHDKFSDVCREITETLPDWFGIEEANLQYIVDAGCFPVIAAHYGEKIIGLLVYRTEGDVCILHWLGIFLVYHRQGIGRQLFDSLRNVCLENQICRIEVETLDPDVQDEAYLKTYRFYERVGFKISEHFQYDDLNKMVRMAIDL